MTDCNSMSSAILITGDALTEKPEQHPQSLPNFELLSSIGIYCHIWYILYMGGVFADNLSMISFFTKFQGIFQESRIAGCITARDAAYFLA